MSQPSVCIYTKNGDKGMTELYNCARKPKDDIHFHALGDCDELNAQLGIAHEYCSQQNNILVEKIHIIQSLLFDIGSHIATPLTNSPGFKITKTEFNPDNVTQLEKWIDEIQNVLPPLQNFILPCGGGFTSCHLHVARAICRRLERHVVTLFHQDDVDQIVVQYVNRLSDFLFVAARYAAMHEKKSEIIWKKF